VDRSQRRQGAELARGLTADCEPVPPQGSARSYLLGVDTGGTCTDAAVLDAVSRSVICSAKALTTKGDLSIGVTEAIAAALAKLPSTMSPADIALVSVSTTLATNAVVEGHGGTVGVVLIGFDDAMRAKTGIEGAFPAVPVLAVAGGHDYGGAMVRPVDLHAVSVALRDDAAFATVEAFAVAAQFAVRNPAHEQAVRDLLISETGKPVTISTELTSELDAPKRALTAVLNARLISRVSALISAVKRSMTTVGLDCPLMIMKGDGTLALADSVAQRPIETVLSGPAASLVGAGWLSGLTDFIVSDMGGTTTDLAVFEHGRPVISGRGAEIGGWKTMVRAIDATTIGLGGDSEVISDGLAVQLGAGRVVPISLLASTWPMVMSMLRSDLADTTISSLHGRFLVRPVGGAQPGSLDGLSVTESDIMAAVGEEPIPARHVLRASGAARALQRLQRRGLVFLSSFTPTDAAHVLGLQSNWSADAALAAAQLLARFQAMRSPGEADVIALCQRVHDEAVRRSAVAVLGVVLGLPTAVDGSVTNPLIDAVSRGERQLGRATVSLRPTVPIVAVGGPVKVFYPEVARRLGCDVVFSPFCDVANAVGAATAVIARVVTVDVVADDGGGFRVHSEAGVERATTGPDALKIAHQWASSQAVNHVAIMGANPEGITVRVRVTKHLLPQAVDDTGLFSAVINAEAIGVPT
jgi:N-methylhydantoinase A/oxoprolinase/acetone carboxylase beta subunit